MATRRHRRHGTSAMPSLALVVALTVALAARLHPCSVLALDVQPEASVFRLPLDPSGLHPTDDAMFEAATPPPPLNAAGLPLLMTAVVGLLRTSGTGSGLRYHLPYYLGESYEQALTRFCDIMLQVHGIQKQGVSLGGCHPIPKQHPCGRVVVWLRGRVVAMVA